MISRHVFSMSIFRKMESQIGRRGFWKSYIIFKKMLDEKQVFKSAGSLFAGK